MSDLRTRLIDVLNVHGVELDDCYCDCGRDCFDGTRESLTDYVEHVADAVIAELGEAGYAIVNRAESQAAVARLIEEHSR